MELVSKNVADLQEELEHAELYHFAACPFEAKTIIAQVAIIALSKMIEKDVAGYPCCLQPDARAEYSVNIEKLWKIKLINMRRAFEFSLLDDRTPEQQRFMDDGLVEFAIHFKDLWI